MDPFRCLSVVSLRQITAEQCTKVFQLSLEAADIFVRIMLNK